MRILVIGASGQVGRELMRADWPAGIELVGLQRPEVDLTSDSVVKATLMTQRPDIVINAAAYTAVDKAESDTATAFSVNSDGPARLAAETSRIGAALLHLSTDYVFDGASPTPYREIDPVMPVNVYGRSKAAGEAAVRLHQPRHIIVRTAWVHGAFGQNFPKTMLRLAAERDDVSVVDDQHGSPTAAAHIAAALVAVSQRIASDRRAARDTAWGTYHFTDAGETTWYGVAGHIFDNLERRGLRRPRLNAIATAQYPTPARRPANSRLDCGLIERTFEIKRRPWQNGLDDLLDELVPAAMTGTSGRPTTLGNSGEDR